MEQDRHSAVQEQAHAALEALHLVLQYQQQASKWWVGVEGMDKVRRLIQGYPGRGQETMQR